MAEQNDLPPGFKMTEIGPLPEEWYLCPVQDIAHDFLGGGTPSTKQPAYWNGDIAWTTSAHISSLYLDRGAKWITPAGFENSSSNLVPRGNLLIGTRVGVGKVAINLIDVAISQDLTGVIVDHAKALPEFLAYAIMSAPIQDLIRSYTRGTTIKGIPRKDLAKIPIPLPPLPEQRAIAQTLKGVDTKIRTEQDRKSALEALFQSLLHHLMTGQVRAPRSMWDGSSDG